MVIFLDENEFKRNVTLKLLIFGPITSKFFMLNVMLLVDPEF